MTRILIFIAAILLCIPTSILVVQGQTKRGKTSAGRRTRSVKPPTLPALSTAVKTPSGLIYVVTRRSNGRKPRPGETVVVNYTGLLGSGAKFDSSLDRGEPISFELGVGRVIKGWDEGIGKLRVGEQATLIIPPHLGYGEKGTGNEIPPNATLIFLVELMGIQEVPASQ